MDEQSQASTPQKINIWMVSTLVLLGVIIGFGISKIPFPQKNSVDKQAAAIKQQAKERTAPQEEPKTLLTQEQIDKLADDDPVIGNPNAPITLVEFSDFQCPFCAQFFQETLPFIEENYIKTGKVKFVYRDFPIFNKHPQAVITAVAAQCANEQGKFKEMHDKIFEQQEEWAFSEKAADLLKGYAKGLGLNTKAFNECLESKKYSIEIRKDLIDGATIGVSGTPGFFINGKPLSGPMPYEEVFKPIFEAELAGKKWELQFDPFGQPSVKTE